MNYKKVRESVENLGEIYGILHWNCSGIHENKMLIIY